MPLQKNTSGIFASIINTVMGVKTEIASDDAQLSQRSQSAQASPAISPPHPTARAVDWQAIALYMSGTLLQIVVMIGALWGLQQLSQVLPVQWSIYPALAFFAFVSVRSRLFSILDNTRSGRTYDSVQRPNWAPPPIAFPIIWMSIAVLRVIASYWVWQALGRNYLSLPLILFMIHLALGDTWNTIFTVETRLGAALPMVLIGPLASSLVVIIAYWQTTPMAGYILMPLCIWLTIASILVFDIWRLNGSEPLYPMKLRA